MIFSKKVYDDKGPDEAAKHPRGDWPIRGDGWIEGDKIDAEAVQGHWRVTPYYAKLRVLEVPENATRVSMMRTGEADIAQIPVKDIADLLGTTAFDSAARRISGTRRLFAGNYYHSESPVSGDPVSREGFTPDADHPWIGDPSDPTASRMHGSSAWRWPWRLTARPSRRDARRPWGTQLRHVRPSPGWMVGMSGGGSSLTPTRQRRCWQR